jgi:6-pyruvoyltetrahydropterin/6-carboxytetrahydropterin synthase
MSKKLVEIVRKESFSSAHRLYNENWSEEKNLEIYDKCTNCHGHNYTLYVTVRGEIDSDTGMVMNLNELKEIMLTHAVNKLDHKNIDVDIPEFKAMQSTAENLTYQIWQWLKPHLIGLYEVKLQETENNFTVYRA